MNYREKFKEQLKEIGTSFTKAINLHCYQCSGYNFKEAKLCKNLDCPLYILKQNRLNKNKD
jgi:hypothetical protein